MEIKIVAIALVVTWIGTLVFYLWNNKLDDKWEQGYEQGMSVKIVEDRVDKKLDTLLEGIDGVQSVNLSSKRYVELLQKEEELNEIKLKIKEVVNEPI